MTTQEIVRESVTPGSHSAAMRNYKSYSAYQNARKLVLLAPKAADCLPRDQRFELASQLRRSSISISSNIAEGAGRHTAAGFYQFLSISLGSLNEVDTQIEIAFDLGYLQEDMVTSLRRQIGSTRQTLIGLMRRVNDNPEHR